MNTTSPPSTLAKRYAVLGIFSLLIWMTAWLTWLSPSELLPMPVATGLAVAPMLPAALLALFRRPSAVFWGGVAALLYFCHAITELWTVPDTWPMSLVELLLALWIIFTGNWDGLRAKLLKRGTPGSA
ncbi:MAG: DUF2069 domain-containing protein [Arenimonas sp.]|jgi:uncharacterized membrane protein